MSELDFKKQLLINEFKTLSKGKSNDEILPLILAFYPHGTAVIHFI